MDFINKQLNRKSERIFLDKEIEKEKIDAIINVINSSPTSSNGHDFTAIIVQDKEIRKELTLNYTFQEHIVQAPLFIIFCADQNRINYALTNLKEDFKTTTINDFLTSSGDAFIAASFAYNAALSLNLGCCFVGLIRQKLNYLKEKLNLKGQMVPIIGLSIGYPNHNSDIKPKLNKVYFEKYDLFNVQQEVEKYNMVMKQYYIDRNLNKKDLDWAKATLKVFQTKSDDITNYIITNWKIKL